MVELGHQVTRESWIYEVFSYLDHDATLLTCEMKDGGGLGDLGGLTIEEEPQVGRWSLITAQPGTRESPDGPWSRNIFHT
jgi:hypothetical protein